MSRIRIKNFGPIKEGYLADDGFMDIKKVTLFIGNQGSGKSTVAKVISSLTWLEKAINRGDVEKEKVTHALFYEIFSYQRAENYFRDDTEIEYIGEKITINYSKKLLYPQIEIKTRNNLHVPKIMYVPAERNFLSVVKNAFGIKHLPDTLYTFAEELRKGQLSLNDKLLELPIGGLRYTYKKDNETSYILGDDFKLDLLESSSGYQSLVPLYLVTKFLSDELQKEENVLREQLSVEQSVRRNNEIAKLMFDDSLSSAQKEERIKEIDSKYLNTCFVNIVEEPEQNLYPSSQWQLLQRLLEFNNCKEASKLIMTTHSPYVINYLTLAVKAKMIAEKMQSSNSNETLKAKLYKIVPPHCMINADDLAIYELDEKDGTIKLLETYKGLPSDENQLNERLEEGNELFAQLLEIQQKL